MVISGGLKRNNAYIYLPQPSSILFLSNAFHHTDDPGWVGSMINDHRISFIYFVLPNCHFNAVYPIEIVVFHHHYHRCFPNRRLRDEN